MNIDIEYLEKALLHIIQHCKDSDIRSVELKHDFYWDIAPADRYDPYNDPKDVTLGQLSSDWEHIQKIAEGNKEPSSYSLVWLASILKYCGEELSKA